LCGEGQLSLKLGRFGAFVGCSNYPECRFTRRLGVTDQAALEQAEAKERVIGVDPETREEVKLKRGPYGPYVERGQGDDLKRSSLPPGLDPAELDLDMALRLLALPREIGAHPETGQPIEAGINRYGPYIKHDRFVRLGGDDDVLTIGMNRAIALLEEARSKSRGAPQIVRELGAHPTDGKPVSLHKGRFGMYVKHGKVNASLPKAQDHEQLSLETAVELLAKRAQSGKGGKAAAGRAAKTKTAATSTARSGKARPKAKAGAKAKTRTRAKAGARTKAGAS
jgi:DNA topoisomerase-1